jgi:hypothetical protein
MATKWSVRSERYPDVVVPAENEEHAMELVRQFRGMTVGFRQRVPWEYGVHDPAEHRSYRRIGPR